MSVSDDLAHFADLVRTGLWPTWRAANPEEARRLVLLASAQRGAEKACAGRMKELLHDRAQAR
jgi:hypothetical protein